MLPGFLPDSPRLYDHPLADANVPNLSDIARQEFIFQSRLMQV